MSKLIGKLLVCLACLTLFHAAFSTYEHLSILKTLSRPESGVPPSIVTEAFVSLICFTVGIVYTAGELKDVTYRGELAHRTIDDSDARMGFMRLSKRGKAIFGDLDR
ncbi:hypothetical protein I308_100421 [Cryptococcus tetragattii IND107]|uniref:Membrane magnesium transporter n=1 Tax=Cryptococcus tetragattii IND107 TaxID=1296105 RepID=A0ABR3C5K7_9TREE